MKLQTNKVIALDIGGCCIELRHREMFHYFGWLAGPPPGLMEMSDRLETGELDEAGWLRHFQSYTKDRCSSEEIIAGWNIVIGPAMAGMAEFLMDLKSAGFKLIFFSDTSTVHIRQVYRDPTITSLIDAAVYSYEVGAKKPAAAMFQAFEQRHGKPFLYVDDKPENIAGGIRQGWNSHRFTDVESLRRFYGQLLQQAQGANHVTL